MDTPDVPESGLTIKLYREKGSCTLRLEDLPSNPPSDDELLWVDLCGAPNQQAEQVWRALKLNPASLPSSPIATNPRLEKFADHFMARVVAVLRGKGLKFQGAVLTVVAGANFAVTHHDEDIAFLADLREREPESARDIGCLGEASFVAALLDWHLSTYFSAVALFEVEIERLESRILSDQPLGARPCPSSPRSEPRPLGSDGCWHRTELSSTVSRGRTSCLTGPKRWRGTCAIWTTGLSERWTWSRTPESSLLAASSSSAPRPSSKPTNA
ncbi:hypothetical protein I5U90_00490 [Stenotrophomonas maltophilia]|nr:hypothetical protein [Stenotrophomonas maltophilia]MCU0994731.1 hypothetical protein [Stenotrophomonas maltophilia]